MLQQSSVFQGSSTTAASSVMTGTENVGVCNQAATAMMMPQQVQMSQQVQQQQRQQSQMVTHQPPPPQARRKRGQDHKENENIDLASGSSSQMGMVSMGNQAASSMNQQQINPKQTFGGRRQGRFVPQNNGNHLASSNQQQVLGQANQQDFNQNVHPNLSTSKAKASQFMNYQQHPTTYQPQNNQGKQRAVNKQQRTPAAPATKQVLVPNFTEQQLDKIATCLNYDQGEICRLFQQKYHQLMVEQQMIAAQQHPQNEQIQQQLAEPNLGLFLQLVQNDLIAKSQQTQQNSSQDSPTTNQQHQQNQSHGSSRKIRSAKKIQMNHAQSQQNHFTAETQQQRQISNPSQTVSSSEQQSASSTVAVVMGSDDIGCCEDSSPLQALISDDDDDENDFQHDQEQPDYDIVEEDNQSSNMEDEEEDQFTQPMGCYGADSTEAYEVNNDQKMSHMVYDTVVAGENDQQYHQFSSQSDYVEAVEGFTQDDDDADQGNENYGVQRRRQQRFAMFDDREEMSMGQHRFINRNSSKQQVVYQGISGYAPEQTQVILDDGQIQQEDCDDIDVYEQEEDEEEEHDEEDDEYIQEEHQFTLNELYAQAHKQLLANGLGSGGSNSDPGQQSQQSKEDARAWQNLYPRLFGGGLTPQNLEQMINLGQANLTPSQAQEILSFQQKQLGEGLASGTQRQEIVVDENGNQQTYEWCSQESDEESNYGGEIENQNINQDRQRINGGEESQDVGSSSCSYRDDLAQNLIHSTLQPPSHLSPAFKRFFSEFENNIDFILRSDYEILPQQRSPFVCKAEQKRVKIKYENLLTASRDMCRRFTGPHSVLQIFIEKIVASIKFIAKSLKESTKNEFDLWTEVRTPITDTQYQKRKQTTSSSLLIGHHKRSSSANPELLITKTSKTSAEDDESQNNQQTDEVQTQAKQEAQEQSYISEWRPKPLMSCIDRYTQFLDELRTQYILIMTNCAPKISKHFTKLTAVIVENTQYEFPSTEIHKAVISKLILNDERYFKQLVHHMQNEFRLNETVIRDGHPDFMAALDLFIREVDDDMRANQTKIDIYMRDLRKHALDEYEDLYKDEQDQIRLGKNSDGKKKKRQHKKNRTKKKKAAAAGGEDEGKGEDQPSNEATATRQQPQKGVRVAQGGSSNCNDGLQQEDDNINNSENGQNNNEGTMEKEQDNQSPSIVNNPEQTGKKKKRNRRPHKHRAKDSLTNELLNNLDTDDLVDFINNCGSKKDDLKKQGNAKADNVKNSGQTTTKKATDGNEQTEKPEINLDSDLVQPTGNQVNTTDQQQEPTDESKTQQTSTTNNAISIAHLSKKQKRGKNRAAKAARRAADSANSPITHNAEITETIAINEKQTHDSAQISGEPKEQLQSTTMANEESDSEEAFEAQLALFKKRIYQETISYYGNKMRPNVTKYWLGTVRKCLQKVEKQISENRAYHSSQSSAN